MKCFMFSLIFHILIYSIFHLEMWRNYCVRTNVLHVLALAQSCVIQKYPAFLSSEQFLNPVSVHSTVP